ncbi:putative FAD-dependent monooxygenase [Seiridium cardinale]
MVDSIPEDCEPISVELQDWPYLEWDNYDGRVMLAGGSAHVMTMYRCEAAKYGITDAADVAEANVSFTRQRVPQKEAVASYEEKLRTRSQRGVGLSRHACIDAHDYDGLTVMSLLLYNR